MFQNMNKMEKENKKIALETRILNGKVNDYNAEFAMSSPVYRSASFEFTDAESMAAAFQNRSKQYTYTRLANPSIADFEKKLKVASEAESVVAVSSGMSAISQTFFTIAYSGCNIISSAHLFGNTFSFFTSTLSKYGVEIRFVDTTNIEEIRNAIDDKTCAFFAEVITNPHMEVVDLKSISEVLTKKNIPMIIDTTLIPWCGINSRDLGIDVEVVSTSKYISGGGTSLGGAIIDYGTHDWKSNPHLGPLLKQKGISRFMFKLKAEIIPNVGGILAPDNAYLQSLGLETLALRYEKMSYSAFWIASKLEDNKFIETVNHLKLESSKYKEIADKQFIGYPGAMFTLSLKSKEKCFKFLDHLKIIRRTTNLFDNKSLAIHPESTIYGCCSFEDKNKMGIKDNLIRLSIGLENKEDLLSDILNSLENID